MTDTLYFSPLVQSYTTNSPDPYYAAYADVSNPSCRFPLDRKFVRSVVLDESDTYVFTPSDLTSDAGSVVVAKVVGAARIKVTGVDSDLSTPTVGYLPTYGTAQLPGYVLLSTFNVSAFEILGQADDTTVELFYGAEEDFVASNIGLVTQASRLYTSTLALVTATPTNVTNSPGTSIVLDEGSYEIRACGNFEPSGAVVTRFNLAVSTASASEPVAGNAVIAVFRRRSVVPHSVGVGAPEQRAYDHHPDLRACRAGEHDVNAVPGRDGHVRVWNLLHQRLDRSP